MLLFGGHGFLPDAMTSVVYAANEPLTLDDAVAKVRKKTGGKVLTADKETKDGQPVYRIKVLMKDGRVRVLLVDPATGKTIK